MFALARNGRPEWDGANLCKGHWADLREAVRAAGLHHLVPKDARVVEICAAEREWSGMVSPTTLDPLHGAFSCMAARFQCDYDDVWTEKKSPCFLCYLTTTAPPVAEDWLWGSVADQARAALQLGAKRRRD